MRLCTWLFCRNETDGGQKKRRTSQTVGLGRDFGFPLLRVFDTLDIRGACNDDPGQNSALSQLLCYQKPQQFLHHLIHKSAWLFVNSLIFSIPCFLHPTGLSEHLRLIILKVYIHIIISLLLIRSYSDIQIHPSSIKKAKVQVQVTVFVPWHGDEIAEVVSKQLVKKSTTDS